jgi:hypothetical protein
LVPRPKDRTDHLKYPFHCQSGRFETAGGFLVAKRESEREREREREKGDKTCCPSKLYL